MKCIRRNEYLTSKERVKKVFAHEEPDRVPINYSANPGIDKRLKEYFGLAPDDNDGLLQVLGVDFRGVRAPYTGPRLHAEVKERNTDPEWGIRTRWIEHSTGGYWDYCDFPLQNARLDQIESWPMPSPEDYDYDSLLNMCEKYEEYAIYLGDPGLADIINTTGMLRGMEQVLIDLITDDPAGLRLIDRRLEIQLEVMRRSLEVVGEKVDFLWMGEDLGTQIGPLIGKKLFRKHILPRHQRFIDLVSEYGLPVMLHSCGSSSWSYEDYISIGLKAVDTLQPEAKDMEPAYLKKHFGGRLVFHGCISTAGPVAFGTRDEVVEYVKDILDIMMPGSGYCFAPTHALQDNSPVENVVAMYEMAHKYRRYE
ncbi:MAG: hypothetical protein GX054_10495 [Clostridiales bacterium]|jgi:uroporphyrinogen decarboxylase|nr:hypothetical protein [Clostridiales bacterium]